MKRSIRAVIAVLAVTIILSPTLASTVPAGAQDPCSGVVEARLAPGGAARVTAAYGLSLKDRAATGAAGAGEVAQLAFGAVMAVLDGPTCNLGYRWWQVRLPDGTVGWAAEGDANTYFVEPTTVGLHVFTPLPDRTALAHYFVTPDGAAEPRGTVALAPVTATPAELWQPVELDALTALLDRDRAECPSRLVGTPFENLSVADAQQLPLPPLEYDVYPAPDGDRLVLVRHFHLQVPRCETAVPERVGISMVSVINADGSVTELFPIPQHGSVPQSSDRYAPSEPSPWNVTLEEVDWSPQGQYIAFVASYRDACAGEACYRFHVYVANLETGQLYVLGEGRHIAWTNGGEGLYLFRLVPGQTQPVAQLYSLRPDGTDRQQVWLPGGAVYVSGEQAPLGFPWDPTGRLVLVGNAGTDQVMLFHAVDRDFTPPIAIPDRMPAANRLSVAIIRGGTALLWTTVRGEFVLQDTRTGEWQPLASQLASTGVAPHAVRPFLTGQSALVEMADGSAYVLDIDGDRLTRVEFGAQP